MSTSTALAMQDPAEPIALPPAITDLGIRTVVQDGVRLIQMPDDLAKRVNLIQPATQIAQADPEITPRLSLVQLSVDLHTYKDERRQLSLNKDGLGLLAYHSGIDIDTEMIPRSLLRDSEIGYKALATMRRSDGSFATWPGQKKIDLDDERAAVEEQVRAQSRKADDGPWSEDVIQQRIKARWVKEKPHFEAKCETKAILRAVALILQLKRGGYSPADLARPFLTLSWGYTPLDPEARAKRADNAAESLYGRRARQLAAAPETSQYDDPTHAQDSPPADVVDIHPSPPAAEDLGGEPDPVAAPIQGEIPPGVAAAGETIVTFGKAAQVVRADGSKGVKVCELSPEHLRWLAIEYQPTTSDREAIVTAARTYHGFVASQA